MNRATDSMYGASCRSSFGSRALQFELENVRACIVAVHIKGHRLFIDLEKVEIGNDELFALKDRFNNVAGIRRDNRASTPFQPGTLPVARWELFRQVRSRHQEADRKHKASALKRVVPARKLMQL